MRERDPVLAHPLLPGALLVPILPQILGLVRRRVTGPRAGARVATLMSASVPTGELPDSWDLIAPGTPPSSEPVPAWLTDPGVSSRQTRVRWLVAAGHRAPPGCSAVGKERRVAWHSS